MPDSCLSCSVVLQERPSAEYAGKGCVSVSAFAVENGRTRRAEPLPSCFELLPCKTSHTFRCSDQSDQVPSIRRVQRRRHAAYLGMTIPQGCEDRCAKTKINFKSTRAQMWKHKICHY